MMKEKAFHHSIRFEVKTAPDMPKEINADERKLMQIIINLLSNAFKFTPDGGEVTLEASITLENEIIISVTDNGSGVSIENQKKLFAPFERLETQKEGTGLGVALCKKIVNLWNGKIGIISPPQGSEKGSCFYFTIPLQNEDKSI